MAGAGLGLRHPPCLRTPAHWPPCQAHARAWEGFRAPGTGPPPPRGRNGPGRFRSPRLVREPLISSSGRRHSCPWGDKGRPRLSSCHLPCPDKARRLLVLGGPDKFRCGGFRTSGDPFVAAALRRERHPGSSACGVLGVSLCTAPRPGAARSRGAGASAPGTRSGAREMLSDPSPRAPLPKTAH